VTILSGIASDIRAACILRTAYCIQYHARSSILQRNRPAHARQPAHLSWRVSLWVCGALFQSHLAVYPCDRISNKPSSLFHQPSFPRPKVVSEVHALLEHQGTTPWSVSRHHTASLRYPAVRASFDHVLLPAVSGLGAVLPCPLYTSLLSSPSPFSVYLYFMIYLALI